MAAVLFFRAFFGAIDFVSRDRFKAYPEICSLVKADVFAQSARTVAGAVASAAQVARLDAFGLVL